MDIVDYLGTERSIGQAAVPQIIERTKTGYFERIVNLLRATAEICYDKIKEINCITCPSKPEASMFFMVRPK